MKTLLSALTLVIYLNTYAQKNVIFPALKGHALEGSVVELPQKPGKKYTIVAICYKRSAEDLMRKWIQPVYDAFPENGGQIASYDVNYFFIPLISGIKMAAREFKESTQEDMWKFIVDCDTKISIIKKQLTPEDTELPYFYVIDNTTAKVVEVVSGKYTPAKLDKLVDALN